MSDRFFKDRRHEIKNINIDGAMVKIDSQEFRQPHIISVREIANSINLQFNKESVEDKNLSVIGFDSQDSEPTKSPDDTLYVQKTFMAIDENYMYVWIPSLSKWKRIPLSDW